MKRYLLLIIILISVKSFAQISIIQKPIPPIQYNLNNIWDFDIINSGTNEVNGYFELSLLSSSGGPIFKAITNDIKIGIGSNTFNQFNITEKQRIFFNNPISQKAQQTNLLSFGDFEICIKLIESGIEISDNCQNFTFFPTNPPTAISPVLCEEIFGFYPNFIWQEPTPLLEGYKFIYTIKVVEVLVGQTPQAAINSNIPIHQKGGINQNFYQYPVDAFPLDSNKKYAWQVKADLEELAGIEGKTSFGNQFLGQSEPECFITSPKKKEEIKEVAKFYLVPKPGFNTDYSKVSKIIPISYQENYQNREIEVFFFDKNKKELKEKINIKVIRGDNRFEIDLASLSIFKHGEFYWLAVKELDGKLKCIYFLYEE